jgi:RNA polymerase sigma-70 factor (ECF subfamily)
LAEELTAQTFEAAASKARRGELSDVTIPWLFVVAKRRLVDHWRARSARERLQDRLTSLPTDELPTSPRSENPEISAALDGLPSRQRLVLTLRYIDEMSVSEIAEGTGMTYRATESLLARARRSFRAGLDQGEVR